MKAALNEERRKNKRQATRRASKVEWEGETFQAKKLRAATLEKKRTQLPNSPVEKRVPIMWAPMPRAAPAAAPPALPSGLHQMQVGHTLPPALEVHL